MQKYDIESHTTFHKEFLQIRNASHRWSCRKVSVRDWCFSLRRPSLWLSPYTPATTSLQTVRFLMGSMESSLHTSFPSSSYSSTSTTRPTYADPTRRSCENTPPLRKICSAHAEQNTELQLLPKTQKQRVIREGKKIKKKDHS